MDSEFFALVLMFQQSVLLHLGKMSNPATGKSERNLVQAKMSIDILTMLRKKTEGNLDKEEDKMLNQSIADAQLNYASEAAKDEVAKKEAPAEAPKKDGEDKKEETSKSDPEKEGQDKKQEATPKTEEPAKKSEDAPTPSSEEKTGEISSVEKKEDSKSWFQVFRGFCPQGFFVYIQ